MSIVLLNEWKLKNILYYCFIRWLKIVNRKEIEMSNLEDYETLYKVDLNFDSNVSEMDSVLTDYIVRVLANHPYYRC